MPVAPSGAFYVYIDVASTGLSSMAFCEQLLSDTGVALTPGNDFGDKDADRYVRLSYATSEQNLHEGLARIQSFTATRSQDTTGNI